ncbi:MAG: hypothetical protein PHE50_02635 [Dehalococcoidales bacterium]|nr:hypothetical protein [Dehalococcoidales bacterium]
MISENFKKTIAFRISTTEQEMLDFLAQESGPEADMSQVIRDAIRESAVNKGFLRSPYSKIGRLGAAYEQSNH